MWNSQRALENHPSQRIVNPLPDLPLDVVEWVKATRYIKDDDGKAVPFSFADRQYLVDLYHIVADSKEIYIVKGRQTEITEMAVNLMMYWAWKYPGVTILYVNYRQENAYRIAKRRLREAVKISPIWERIIPLRKHHVDGGHIPQRFNNPLPG